MAYTVEYLLSVLHPHYPVKVDALCKNRRRVEHGLTTVGLKIHSDDNRELLNLIEALGGRSEVIANRFYAHARASVTVILPPVGSARSAIMLPECIEKYFGHPIFHNPRYQIQVCSPPPTWPAERVLLVGHLDTRFWYIRKIARTKPGSVCHVRHEP